MVDQDSSEHQTNVQSCGDFFLKHCQKINRHLKAFHNLPFCFSLQITCTSQGNLTSANVRSGREGTECLLLHFHMHYCNGRDRLPHANIPIILSTCKCKITSSCELSQMLGPERTGPSKTTCRIYFIGLMTGQFSMSPSSKKKKKSQSVLA